MSMISAILHCLTVRLFRTHSFLFFFEPTSPHKVHLTVFSWGEALYPITTRCVTYLG